MPDRAPSTLNRRLRQLRRLHLWRHGLESAALALAFDMAYDLAAFAGARFAGADLYLGPLAPGILLVLLARALPRCSLRRFATYLDSRFTLSDRLYSYLAFRTEPDVPPELRAAQERECLRSIPFGSLRNALRPRLSRGMIAVAVMVPAMVLLHFNQDYSPSGPLQRSLVELVGQARRAPPTGAPARHPGLPADAPLPGDDLEAGPEPADAPTDDGGTGDGTQEGDEEVATGEAGDRDPAEGEPAADPEPGEGTEGGALGIAGGDGEGDGEGAAGTGPGEQPHPAPPKSLESQRTSEAVSKPTPPVFGEEVAIDPDSLRRATHYLTLLPGRGGGTQGNAGGDAPELLGLDLSQFPAEYRDHITDYYKALLSQTRE